MPVANVESTLCKCATGQWACLECGLVIQRSGGDVRAAAAAALTLWQAWRVSRSDEVMREASISSVQVLLNILDAGG